MKLKALFLICTFTLIGYGCKDVIADSSTKDVATEKVTTRASLGERTFVFPPIQWESFDTHEQKLAACQIPDSLLNKISTTELVQICMEYPLLFDAFAFDTPLKGLKVVASRFNGFQELMKRKDNCLRIFNYLMDKDIRSIDFTGLSLEEEGRIVLNHMLCEYLLSFDDILTNATNEIKNEITRYAYNVMENKENRKQHFALGDLSSTTYLCVKALNGNPVQTRTAHSEPDDFLDTGMFQDREQYQEMKRYCQTLVQY